MTCQPSPRSAACTTITTKAATDIAEAMPEVMLLAISSPRVYSLLTTERAPDAVIGPNHSRRRPSCHTLRAGAVSRRDCVAGDVLARLGVMESRSCQRPASLGVAAIIAFLVLPIPSSAQVSCRPNIFGGQDCTSPEGHSSSTPNVFGGYDTTFPDGSRSSSRPNIFGGEDATTPEGIIESRPNIFGGKDYRLPSGEPIESHPNIFGGRDFRQPNGHVVECRPNLFGGEDCR